MDFAILQPDAGIFENASFQTEKIKGEKSALFLTERVEYPETGGIFKYNLGCKYPEKGFPTLERIGMVNFAKKATLTLIMPIVTKDLALPLIVFAALPYKRKIAVVERYLSSYVRLLDEVLSPCYLQEKRYMVFCQELRRFLDQFFINLGISPELADKTAKAFVTLIEYDNAYRFRIEDLFSETSALELSENPSKTIKRLLAIYVRRENPAFNKQGFGDDYILGSGIGSRFKSFAQLLSFLLRIPKVNKAFRNALFSIDFSKLQLDDADRYYCLIRSDYSFFGLDLDTRIQMWYAVHDNQPPPQILING